MACYRSPSIDWPDFVAEGPHGGDPTAGGRHGSHPSASISRTLSSGRSAPSVHSASPAAPSAARTATHRAHPCSAWPRPLPSPPGIRCARSRRRRSTSATSTSRCSGRTRRAPPRSSLPAIAESWETSEDGLTWTFTIREGATVPRRRAGRRRRPSRRASRPPKDHAGASFIWAPLESIEAPDDTTVVMNLTYSAPMDLVAASTYGAWIVSPKALAASAADDTVLRDGHRRRHRAVHDQVLHPGQEGRARGVRRLLERRGAHRTYDIVDISITPDAVTAQQMLTAGRSTSPRTMPLENVDTVASRSGAEVTHGELAVQLPRLLQHHRGRRSTTRRCARRSATPCRTRTSSTSAVPGYGTQSHGPVPKGIFPYTEDVPQYSQDLEKAKALLAEAGHADGLTLTLTYASENPAEARFVPLIKDAFAKIGVTLDVRAELFNQQWENAKADPANAQDIFVVYYWPTYSDAGVRQPVLAVPLEREAVLQPQLLEERRVRRADRRGRHAHRQRPRSGPGEVREGDEPARRPGARRLPLRRRRRSSVVPKGLKVAEVQRELPVHDLLRADPSGQLTANRPVGAGASAPPTDRTLRSRSASMLRFLASRLGTAVIVLLVLTLVVFVLSRVIPADPAVVYAGPKAPPEELARIREQLGFDQPLIVQYLDYLGGLVTGDWGNSLATKRPVLDEARHAAAGHPRADLRGHADRGRRRHRPRGRRRQAPGQSARRRDPLPLDRRRLDAGVLARTAAAGPLRRAAAQLLPATGAVQHRGRVRRTRSRPSPASRSSTASSPATGSPAAMACRTWCCRRSPSPPTRSGSSPG